MNGPLSHGSLRAYVALGANLGQPRDTFRTALLIMARWSLQPLRISSLYETEPVDCPPGSPQFLNAVAEMMPHPAESPEALLEKLLALERHFGRAPSALRNAPRPLDLDLIAFGSEQRSTARLVLPHPRAHLRRFVLEPLAELAPDLVLPGQSLSVRELLERLPPGPAVRRVGTLRLPA